MTLRRTWKRYRPLMPVLAVGLVGVALLPAGHRSQVVADTISPAAVTTPPAIDEVPAVALVMPRHGTLDRAVAQPAIGDPRPLAPSETAVATPVSFDTAPAAAPAPQASASILATEDAPDVASTHPGHIGGVSVNVHSGPSDAANTLFVADAGEQVAIKSTQNGWVEIIAPDGGSGWVYGRFVADGV